LLLVPLIFLKKRVRFYCFDYNLFFFYFLTLGASAYSPDPSTSLRFFFGVSLFLGMYLCVKLSMYDLRLVDVLSTFGYIGKLYFLLAMVFYCAGLLSYGVWQEHELYYGLMIERQMPRLVAFGLDPNISAMTLVPFIFYFMLSKKSYTWMSLGLILLFATMSRGAIFSLAFGLVGVAVFKPTKGTITSVLAVIIAAVVGFALLMTLEIFPLAYLEQRVTDIASGSGRIEIWMNALEMFSMRPLFGWGGGAFRDINDLFFGDSRYAHNTYIEVLVENGLIGFCVFLCCVALMLKHAVNMSADSRLLFVLPSVFAFLSAMFFLSVYLNQIFVLYLALLNIGLVRKGSI